MIRRPPRSTRVRSSAASDVYKRQVERRARGRPAAGAGRRTLDHESREGPLGVAVPPGLARGVAGLMAIKGSLREAGLADVCQLLSMGQKTGCLSVTDRSR